MLNRRDFLQTSLLTTGALYLSPAKAASSAATLANSHHSIAEAAKRIKKANSSLTLLYPAGSLTNIKPLCDKFTQDTGIAFILKETGVNDINTDIVFGALKKQFSFDIALPATFWIPDLVDAKAIIALDQYALKHEPAGFRDTMLYQHGDQFNNSFYGYQTDGDTYMMFYNRPMMDDPKNRQRFLKEQGYELAIPTTWQQLDTMIEFFHQPDKNQYGGSLFRVPGYAAWEWWTRFHAKGFYPMKDDLTPQINNAAGISALKELIAVSDYLHPNSQQDELFDNWATFSEGNTFCNIGWGGTQKYLNNESSKIKDKLYFGPTPGGVVGNQAIDCSLFNWGWNYVVSSLSTQQELAYLFTLYCTSPVMSTIAVQKNGFFDPFREEHYIDNNIQNSYSKAFLEAHKKSLKNSMPDFYLEKQNSYLTNLQENIYLAMQGHLTPELALETTAQEWRVISTKVGDRQKTHWQNLKTKYPQNLRNILS